MSVPSAQSLSEAKPNNDREDSSSQLQSEDSILPKATAPSSTHPAESDRPKDPLRDFVVSTGNPREGNCFDMLGSDGVWRVLQWLPGPPDQPTGVAVYDAKPMPPELIKMYLDTRPWRQELEDRFRGVDGRTVPQE
jgi:hypothetical protein